MVSECKLPRQTQFIMGCAYIHPNISVSDLEMLLYGGMITCSKVTNKIIENMILNTQVPIVLVGFSMSMQNELTGSKLHENTFQSRLSVHRSSHDSRWYGITYARNINVVTIYTVCYFSYHRPIVH